MINEWFKNFDFSVLNSAEFKEDSVREEILSPILRGLGYQSSGVYKVTRSKSLIHPYVMIGSQKHKINIIPDYTLYINEKPIAIIEAKAPDQQIYKSIHVEQAYSYAIHPEIQSQNYCLCNGKELILYSISKWEPIIRVNIPSIIDQWNIFEKALSPKFLENPDLRDFDLDYGLAMYKLGFNKEVKQIFILHHLQLLIKVDENLYTVSTMTEFGDEKYLVSLDITANILFSALENLEKTVADDIKEALSRHPFQKELSGKLIISCFGFLGEIVQGQYEDFAPILVKEITDIKFDNSIILNKKF